MAVFAPHQHGIYTKKMISFQGEAGGGVELTSEAIAPPPDLPQEPEPEPQPTRAFDVREEVGVIMRATIRRHPPTLRENPTAEERWRYLRQVLKQKAADQRGPRTGC